MYACVSICYCKKKKKWDPLVLIICNNPSLEVDGFVTACTDKIIKLFDRFERKRPTSHSVQRIKSDKGCIIGEIRIVEVHWLPTLKPPKWAQAFQESFRTWLYFVIFECDRVRDIFDRKKLYSKVKIKISGFHSICLFF